MKNLFIVVLLSLCYFSSQAQYLKYGFTASTSVYTELTGATAVSTSTSAMDFLGNNKTSVPIPIGFTFNFNGSNYTQVVASSDGFLSFNTSATSTPINNLSGTLSTRRPLLAPLWDDLSGTTAASAARYVTTGAPGARTFTMEWLNWQWSTTNSGPAISFQVKLTEGTNHISFHYRQDSGAVINGSASIGIASTAMGPGSFLSVDNTGSSPVASLSNEVATTSTKPATGQVYTFYPLPDCAGLPVGGTTVNNNRLTCLNAAALLDVKEGSTAANLSFQWQSSADGQNWTDILSGNLPFYPIPLLTNQQYYRRRTSCSGSDAYSTPLLLTPGSAPLNDNYCGALPLTIGAVPLCANTTCATSVNDPLFSKSTPNNTVWYTYTPTTSGPATIVLSRPQDLGSGFLDGWLGVFTTAASCPAPVFTEVPSSLAFNLSAIPEVTLTTPNLTAGVTYFLMVDGSAGSYGNFCIQVVPNPVIPGCTANVSPLNGSTVNASFAVLSWNRVPDATAYDILVSEDSGATYRLKATVTANTATSTTISDLSPGAVYYWYVLPKSGGGVATGCQGSASMFSTASPPTCSDSYLSPGSNAMAVPVNSPVVFEWTGVSASSSYDLFIDTTYPPRMLYRNIVTTTDTVPLLLFNTKYYWTVRPRNSFTATGCRIDSFTTAPAVTTCTPLYGRGVAVGDSLVLFRLNGESGSQLKNSPAVSNSSYSDYYNASNVMLGAGNAYVGFARTGASSNRITIWVDLNDNGFFEASERLLNNQDITSSAMGTYFSLSIPPNATPGEHRMRVRDVYNEVQPVDACNSYMYGESEDYKVTILTTSAVKSISPGAPGSCLPLASTTIDTASNNTRYFVPILDTAGNMVMSINAAGNNLGKITNSSFFVNPGTVRTSADGIKYLNRNFGIVTNNAMLATPVILRFYYTNQELNALRLADPSVSGSPSINMSQSAMICSSAAAPPVFDSLYMQLASGTMGNGYFADFPVQRFSGFYLHGRANTLPVTTTPLRGERIGSKVVLRWSTFNEVNNRGFEVQRSGNGTDYEVVGFIASKAGGGNSAGSIPYELTDNVNSSEAVYYRLRQIDHDGNSRFSNVVSIAGAPTGWLQVTSIYPNPAATFLNLAVTAPVQDFVKISVFDATGKIVLQMSQALDKEDNRIQLNVGHLSRGVYLLTVNCRGNCAPISTRFNRQ
ncbi:T9SS type A sorting domain-containing protein [Segetibacter sp. 3557_3]|uniref:GEVED domain-containing protein n=1 Tax=Segetibacter sp. 3557_3 TaxID=2547429 RepID=UPI0010584ED1|nr:GEVED domain-containing protein [Segetibacter sp. 3557_3]TDH27929.1 T9SS type A sorting domain-containing protein [Segetibacter sp. 3557_3]